MKRNLILLTCQSTETSYSFTNLLSFSVSKYKNTTILIEIYTLVVLVHKRKKPKQIIYKIIQFKKKLCTKNI